MRKTQKHSMDANRLHLLLEGHRSSLVNKPRNSFLTKRKKPFSELVTRKEKLKKECFKDQVQPAQSLRTAICRQYNSTLRLKPKKQEVLSVVNIDALPNQKNIVSCEPPQQRTLTGKYKMKRNEKSMGFVSLLRDHTLSVMRISNEMRNPKKLGKNRGQERNLHANPKLRAKGKDQIEESTPNSSFIKKILSSYLC